MHYSVFLIKELLLILLSIVKKEYVCIEKWNL